MKKLIFIFVLSVNILSAQEILRIDNSISSISYSGTHFLHNWDATNDNITGLIELNDNQISKIGVIAKVKDFKSGNSSLDSNSFRVLDALRIPNIVFRSLEIIDSLNVINVSGTISFHGIEKDLNVLLNKSTQNDNISLSGNLLLTFQTLMLNDPLFCFKK